MIRITKQTDYAIVLLSRLAASAGQQFKAPELAEDTRLPVPMVSKILKTLVRGGVLESTRGVKGGYFLGRPPEEVSVAEVIVALEGPIAVTECIDDAPGECGYTDLCPMRSNWNQINLAIRSALEGISLAEMGQPLPPEAMAEAAERVERLVTLGGRD